MDDLYKFLDRISGLSLLDTGLLVLIFLLVKEKFRAILADLKCARERITRLEKALIGSGIELGDIEEE